MKYEVNQVAIGRAGDKYVVVDKKTGKQISNSVKYDDESHCLRFVKHITKTRGDWRILEVERLWETGGTAILVDVVPDISEPTDNVDNEPLVSADEAMSRNSVEEAVVEGEDLSFETEATTENKEVRQLLPGEYYCSKCSKIHRENKSELGRRHKKYKTEG